MNPILIVDDEAAIAMLVRRILTEAGYRCQAVTDSRAAADLLEKNHYDLVLLDVMMPHLDGYDLLAYLRPTGTPCIFITAKDAVAERVRGLNSGADDYIVKPFASTELVARVESVLRRAGRTPGRERLVQACLNKTGAKDFAKKIAAGAVWLLIWLLCWLTVGRGSVRPSPRSASTAAISAATPLRRLFFWQNPFPSVSSGSNIAICN